MNENIRHRVTQTELKKAIEENRWKSCEQGSQSFLSSPKGAGERKTKIVKNDFDARDDKGEYDLTYYKSLRQRRERQENIMSNVRALKEQQETLLSQVDSRQRSKIHPKLKDQGSYKEDRKKRDREELKRHSRTKQIQSYSQLIKDIKSRPRGKWELALSKQGQPLHVSQQDILEADEYFECEQLKPEEHERRPRELQGVGERGLIIE